MEVNRNNTTKRNQGTRKEYHKTTARSIASSERQDPGPETRRRRLSMVVPGGATLHQANRDNRPTPPPLHCMYRRGRAAPPPPYAFLFPQPPRPTCPSHTPQLGGGNGRLSTWTPKNKFQTGQDPSLQHATHGPPIQRAPCYRSRIPALQQIRYPPSPTALGRARARSISGASRGGRPS